MNVQTMRKRPAAGMYLQRASLLISEMFLHQPQGRALWQCVAASWPTLRQDHSLFYRVRGGIQPLLDLVRLLPQLFQWTWIIGCVCPARSAKSVVLRTEVITRRAPYLRHGRCSCKARANCCWPACGYRQPRALCTNLFERREEAMNVLKYMESRCTEAY